MGRILTGGVDTLLLFVAGVVTLALGVSAIAKRHHMFVLSAALVAVTVQGVLLGFFRNEITPAGIGLLAFECATIPIAWLSGLPRPPTRGA